LLSYYFPAEVLSFCLLLCEAIFRLAFGSLRGVGVTSNATIQVGYSTFAAAII